VLSAHQPCYLPWMGFWDKVLRADTFVLLDDVQYSTGADNYTNRVKVKSPGGVKWLTIPLEMDGHLDRTVADMLTLPGWREKHIAALRDYYRHAPYIGLLDGLLPPEGEYLADVAGMSVLQLGLELVPKLVPNMVTQSALGVTGHKTELIVNLCKATGEKAFLFGGHGKDYADLALLRDHGIEPVFQEYEHPMYQQLHGPFVAGLSVVDAILNAGVKETRRLLCL
jgi:hypothetical protein